jgi:hypothetical protein
MAKAGELEQYVYTDKKRSAFGELYKREYIRDFLYDDTYEGNGCVVVSEVYRQKHGFLDSVIISKRQVNDESKHSFHTIAIKLQQPGSLTEVHTMLQLSGLHYIGQRQWIQSTYKDGDKDIIVKEVKGRMFIKQVS